MTNPTGEFFWGGGETWYTYEAIAKWASGELRDAPAPAIGDQFMGDEQVTTETVADILRPLVERTVEYDTATSFTDQRGDLHPIGTLRALDHRFDALRRQGRGEYGIFPAERPELGIDASLGAIVRAAAACGFLQARWLPPSEIENAVGFGKDQWQVQLTRNDWGESRFGFGLTVEEAAARALLAAVGDTTE